MHYLGDAKFIRSCLFLSSCLDPKSKARMRAIFLISILMFVGACKDRPSVPKPLRGVWSASGTDGGDFGWQKKYTISETGFVMTGYPPIESSADLVLLKSEGNRYLVRYEEYIFNGKQSEPKEAWFELSTDQKTLTFEDTSFRKQPKQKKK